MNHLTPEQRYVLINGRGDIFEAVSGFLAGLFDTLFDGALPKDLAVDFAQAIDDRITHLLEDSDGQD